MINSAVLKESIRQSSDAQIRQQDEFRARLDVLLSREPDEAKALAIQRMGWAGLVDRMSAFRIPPSSEDWNEILGLSWESHPKHLQLQKIPEFDTRASIYFLSEFADQKERLRAGTGFCDLFGGTNQWVNNMLSLWLRRSVATEMLAHPKMLNAVQTRQLAATVEAIDVIGQHIMDTCR